MKNTGFLPILIIVCVGLYVASQSPASPHTSVGHSYHDLAYQDALEVGIDPTLFVRQIHQESGFNPQAVSPAGAIGIAQFMPATAAGLGVDPHDPAASLKAAAQLMSRYQKQYGGYNKALAAYNAGPGALQSAVDRCGWSWRGCLPRETQGYISAVMGV
jgi:soluble lytic murein transglycosylase-like protein